MARDFMVGFKAEMGWEDLAEKNCSCHGVQDPEKGREHTLPVTAQ